jgi:UDPglucose 6-dehydrogenase
MRVTVVGLGYVGLVTGACIAEWEHDVTGIEVNAKRLHDLKEGRLPALVFRHMGVDPGQLENRRECGRLFP